MGIFANKFDRQVDFFSDGGNFWSFSFFISFFFVNLHRITKTTRNLKYIFNLKNLTIMRQMKFTQNLARAAMLLLLAVLTSTGAWADEAEDLSTPLTLEATTNGTTVTFTLASVVTNPVEYRTWNGTAWTAWATYTSATPVLLDANQKVQFRGENEAYGFYDWDNPIYSNILCDKKCYVYGNIMSLVKKDGFAEAVTLTKHSNFYYLFYNSNIDIDTSKQLMLPATTLAENCYSYMFHKSTLTKAPALPATTLADYCYYDMFYDCYDLTDAPVLPATTLAEGCYQYMFYECTSLENAPALPATTLTQYC